MADTESYLLVSIFLSFLPATKNLICSEESKYLIVLLGTFVSYTTFMLLWPSDNFVKEIQTEIYWLGFAGKPVPQ